jgi:hypothetical protein
MTPTQALLTGAVLLCGLLAIFLGGPLTTWVFAHVDRRGESGTGPTAAGIRAAAVVLRGGQTIGLLERSAAFLTVVAGYPEGILAIIALKGLGRFAELRTRTEGAAERFLIGSFTSLLFASALAGLARVALGHLWP